MEDKMGLKGAFSIDAVLGLRTDCHTHLSDELTPERRLEANRYLGFDRCVLVSVDNDNTPIKGAYGSEESQRCAEKYPDTFRWMCDADPRDRDALQKLQRHRANGAVGVGEFTHGVTFTCPEMDDYLFECGRLGFPILFHISPDDSGRWYGIIDGPRLCGLESALAKHPDVIFIGHSQPFWFEMGKTDECDSGRRNSFPGGKITAPGRVSELMERYPNLWCDLSASSGSNALMRDEEFALSFIMKYQDRLIYGSDWADGCFRHTLPFWLEYQVMSGRVPLDVYKKIVRLNAEKLFWR